ncbi:transcriptional regulator [Pontibacillus halophilus JSM 076056 = DSM 19796]|uniref:Transcriptional regulator n=1 Tax=Pontibacillus halophilus JSM 076056 = DSM 19796 TaxID=1385510 RepID=A0A0A5GQA6_9BACI|nr:helix-turn-helix transcriptional regulator [Pontibacillus halophilus]KGX93355.1 transcriptional regulator [Pontibacillus halophilus JSM 076056 = DSM 19796]
MYGERIREIRHRKRMSLSELAALSGISKSYLSQIEREKQQNPSIQLLSKIAKALNVSIHDIIQLEKETEDQRAVTSLKHQLTFQAGKEKDWEIIKQLEEVIDLLKERNRM